MNKKLLLATIITSLLLVGCSVNTTLQSKEYSSTVVNATIDMVDYNQYVKKRWIEKKDTNNNSEREVSFSISKIENGKITGKLSAISFAPTDRNLLSFESGFEGTINKDIAECQFNDLRGNKGNLKLVFKANNEMEATITLIDKSKTTIQPPEGTFEFVPDNIKNIKGFVPIESQSFMVNLNSWGNVKFVSGKLTAGNHIPVVFYLTNKDGDILYDFDAALPYNVDVKAVSFVDVNKDGLKDIIIIVAGNDGSGQVATVYLQKADGSFANDPKLDQEINNSGNNKDVKTVMNYLSQKL